MKRFCMILLMVLLVVPCFVLASDFETENIMMADETISATGNAN